METLVENKDTILYYSIPVTVVVVIFSIVYTLRNTSKFWNKEKSKEAVENDSKSTEKRKKDKSADDKKKTKMNKADVRQVANEIDPVHYCEHIQSEVKKARHRVATREVKKQMTDDELAKERDIQRKQMEDIFKLMASHEDKFGKTSLDEVSQQMRLYV